MSNLGERLKNLRKEHGYTQVELAKKLGVTQSLVWRWESGVVKRLSKEKLKDLAKLYDVSEDYIQNGEAFFYPQEVEDWLHLPENKDMILNLYKNSVLEKERKRLEERLGQ